MTEANVASAVWHSLLAISDDFKYIPQLAADPIPTTENGGVSPGHNGDAMTVTWKLRDGLKWSDGQPLTCDDFKYAWEWVMDKDNTGVVLAGFEDTTAVDCPSDTDIVMHYNKVFEGYLTQYIAPLPRHYLSKIPVADQVNGAGFRPDEIAKMPVPGPFKYESVTPQAELRLAKNDQYTNPRTGKPANLDEIVFKWYGDPDAMIAGYRNNEIDVAFDLQDSDLPKVQDLGDQVAAIPALLYEFLRPNWSPGPFTTEGTNKNTGGCSRNPAVQDRGTGCPTADPAIRQAIAYAIDKDEINTRLLGGNAAVANTNISPSAWFYKDTAGTTFDPDKAKQILADGGWADSDGDGIVEKDGLQGQDRAVHDDPAGPPGHAGPRQRMAQERRHRQRHQPGVAVGHLRRLQRVDQRHPVRPRAEQLRPRGARVQLLDRPARQLHQLPQQPVPPDGRERCAGQRSGHRQGA